MQPCGEFDVHQSERRDGGGREWRTERLKADRKTKGIKWDWEMQWWGEEGHALGKPAGIEREEGVNGRGGGCA
jgi:hypothetical protein